MARNVHRRGRMRVNWAVCLAIVNAVSGCVDQDSTSTQAASSGQRKVIMFLWDGFPYSDVNPTDTPNLWAMMQGGANMTDNHSTFPTFTMVNSGTMATGSYPGKAGIYDNILWQPGPTGKDSGGGTVNYSQPVDLTDYAILTTLDAYYNNQLLLVGTLFQAAQDAGLKTAAIGKSGPAFVQDY